ncbi:MAG: hypothetical protein V7771_08660 [Shewanella psychromarinicola]
MTVIGFPYYYFYGRNDLITMPLQTLSLNWLGVNENPLQSSLSLC